MRSLLVGLVLFVGTLHLMVRLVRGIQWRSLVDRCGLVVFRFVLYT